MKFPHKTVLLCARQKNFGLEISDDGEGLLNVGRSEMLWKFWFFNLGRLMVLCILKNGTSASDIILLKDGF